MTAEETAPGDVDGPPPEQPVAGAVSVEATGETVGEAKWNALRELERLHPAVDRDAVEFQVVSEGERGLLGVGYAPARVVATAPEVAEAEPADESPLAAEVRSLLLLVVGELGIPCRVEVAEDETSVTASCSGGDLGMLIGKHGQTIDAIQYLLNAIVAKDRREERKEVVVDAAGYRARRRATLEGIALRSAERALASGMPVELDPMTAVERKVVHLRLKEVDGIETASEGTEPNRFVVVRPSSE
ncbi:MAG TPA: RNA-binding cell elongation regulator Jag/EloR [Gaiellaceae bacterium]|nr:RNA-binding cell elongation regulator Jag/EloR [Gaiellaceae bacterium]